MELERKLRSLEFQSRISRQQAAQNKQVMSQLLKTFQEASEAQLRQTAQLVHLQQSPSNLPSQVQKTPVVKSLQMQPSHILFPLQTILPDISSLIIQSSQLFASV